MSFGERCYPRSGGVWMPEPSGKKASKEIVTVQALRAIAAISVIFAHLSALHVTWQMGVIGVDIFFALSGFVMVLSTRSLRYRANAASIFLCRRFIRIVPMYWLFTGLVILHEARGHQFFHASVIIHSLLFIPAWQGAPLEHYFPILAVGWTLVFEVFFYLCFAICLKVRISPFLLAPLFIVLSFVGLHHQIQSIALLSIFNYLLLEFILGMVFAWLYLHQRILPWKVALVLCLGCITCFFVRPILSDAVHKFVWAPAAMLFVYACLSFERYLVGNMPRVIEILGDASYSIYLSHQQFVLYAFSEHFPKLHGKTYLFCLFEIIVCCIVGVIVHYAVERPILAWFKVWIGGHPPA
jgi:exopolysaccharide production protein ExoZ